MGTIDSAISHAAQIETPIFELRFETDDAKWRLAPNFKLRDERRRLSLGFGQEMGFS